MSFKKHMTLKKPTLTPTTRHRSVSLKPVNFNEQDRTFRARFVTPEGKELDIPCTKDVFRRIDGPKNKAGLDMAIDKDYVIHVTQESCKVSASDVKLVTNVHAYPKVAYARGLVPEKSKGVTALEIRVLANGDIDVEVVPPKVTYHIVQKVLAELDSLSEVSAGDILLDEYEVTSVAGNRISIELLP